MKLAPIILFAFKRPWHMKATLEALRKNNLIEQSDFFIFVDGVSNEFSDEDKELHRQVIDIAKSVNWANKCEVIESNVNKGLAASVIDGVTSILKKYKKVIVLEDDLITSPLFLEYMNAALLKYEYVSEVACISGYVYPLKRPFESSYFIKGADCWGWATWEDKWFSTFKNEPKKLYIELLKQNKLKKFNFNESYPYATMLKNRIENKNQSWAILWYASAFLDEKLCLYPSTSLIHNIGNDGSGTHSNVLTSIFDASLSVNKLPVLPEEITENKLARREFELFFRRLNIEGKSGRFSDKLFSKIRKIIKK